MMGTKNLKTFTEKFNGVKKDTTRPTTDIIPKMLKYCESFSTTPCYQCNKGVKRIAKFWKLN